jgi:hypothetical protein
MAEELEVAEAPERRRVLAVSIHAVAHAFMMLGLISSEGAEPAITRASLALAQREAGGSEPAVWPGQADDYWSMRAEGRHSLAWVPRAVAVGALWIPLPTAGLRCEWFRLGPAGLRFQVQAAAVGRQPSSTHASMAIAELSAADDAGRSYRLRWESGHGSGQLWMGEVVAKPVSEREQPDDVAWFELFTAEGRAGRVVFAPPPAVPVGAADLQWPSPAETYLAWLSRQDPAPEPGLSAAWEVVAAVAEGLVSVGAMPAHSPLLPPLLGRHKRSSRPDLPHTWPQPVRLGTPPDFQIGLCVPLPFEHAAAVIEGISAWGEDIQLHIYGWPWIQGQRWPARIPSFKVRAIDDLGQEYEGVAGTWRGYGAGEGHCDFTLWPSVPRRAARVRVVISTLWEARWADIKLPSR